MPCICKYRAYNAILLTKTTAAPNEVALSYHRVRGLYFLAVVFAMTINNHNINAYKNCFIFITQGVAIHYTLYSIHYTLYTIQYTLYTIQYNTLYTRHNTMYCIHYVCYTMHNSWYYKQVGH